MADDHVPPLADLSPAGRALRNRKRQMHELLEPLMSGLDAELAIAKQNSINGIREARERLVIADQMVSELVEGVSDPKLKATILDRTYEMMAAAADALSRIERRRLPTIIRKLVKSDAGKASGKARAKKSEKEWRGLFRQKASDFFSENPYATQSEAIGWVVKNWEEWSSTTLPEQRSTLDPYLSKCLADGTIKKCTTERVR